MVYKLRKGLEQADLISPLLFMVVAGVLNLILNVASSVKLIAGIGQLEVTKHPMLTVRPRCICPMHHLINPISLYSYVLFTPMNQ